MKHDPLSRLPDSYPRARWSDYAWAYGTALAIGLIYGATFSLDTPAEGLGMFILGAMLACLVPHQLKRRRWRRGLD